MIVLRFRERNQFGFTPARSDVVLLLKNETLEGGGKWSIHGIYWPGE